MSSSLRAYNEAVSQRFQQPRYVGVLAANDDGIRVSRGQAGIVGRTNVVHWYLALDARDQIVECKYQVFGCGIAVAACEWAAEQLQGQGFKAIAALSVQQIIEALAIDTMKHHCAVLVKEAIDAAAANLTR